MRSLAAGLVLLMLIAICLVYLSAAAPDASTLPEPIRVVAAPVVLPPVSETPSQSAVTSAAISPPPGIDPPAKREAGAPHYEDMGVLPAI